MDMNTGLASDRGGKSFFIIIKSTEYYIIIKSTEIFISLMYT